MNEKTVSPRIIDIGVLELPQERQGGLGMVNILVFVSGCVVCFIGLIVLYLTLLA